MEGVSRELRVHEKGRARKLMQEGMWEEKGAGDGNQEGEGKGEDLREGRKKAHRKGEN